MKCIRLMSNIYGLEDHVARSHYWDLHRISPRSLNPWQCLRIFLKSFKYDFILLNGASGAITVLGLLKLLVPINKCRVVSLDSVMRRPKNFRDRVVQFVKRIAFRQVDMFFEYFKDTRAYEEVFGIPNHKFRYVPFKVNSLDIIGRTAVSDDGYLVCAGRSMRDFSTLIEAVRGTGIPTRIVTQSNDEISVHGSSLDDSSLPENVEVRRDAHTEEDFIQHIAGARLLVSPIRTESMVASGISVYLMAMAMGKCTILSDMPGARDVLGEDKAIIVPAADPQSLRRSIEEAYHDSDLRFRYADNAYRYAMSLGDDAAVTSTLHDLLVDEYEAQRATKSDIAPAAE